MTVEHLCIITSVVHTNLQSVFDAKTRLDQLLNTINSVKRFTPCDYIVVLEGGVLNDTERELIKANCHDLYEYNVNGLPKSDGEIALIRSYFEDQTSRRVIPTQTISKISGRYELTSTFEFFKYPMESTVIKHYGVVYDTRYYRFHAANLPWFIEKLPKVAQYIKTTGQDIEHAYYANEILPKTTMIHPDILGCRGFNAPIGYLQID